MAEVRTESAFKLELVGTVVNKAILTFVLKLPSRLLNEVQDIVENVGVKFVNDRVVPGTEKGELTPPQLRNLLNADITLTVFTLTECRMTRKLPYGPIQIRKGGRLPNLTVRPIIPFFEQSEQGGALAYLFVTLTCMGSCF